MVKIGFLGIGACGNNICEIADQNGYNACIMNTSPEDLGSISGILDTSKLLIGTNGGCGKNRKLAQEDVKNSYKNIINFVKDKFSNCNLIYVVFSTGGGTGSGMSPIIIDLLNKSFPNKKFGAIMVLPTFSESVVSFINSISCIKEVFSLNIPTMIIDNNNFTEYNYTKKKLYDAINRKIISNFDLIFKTYRKNSKYGNLDSKDLTKLFNTSGMLTINECILPKNKIVDSHSFNKSIIDSWNKNIYCKLDFDKTIKRIGFIYEMDDKYTNLINYTDIYKEIGEPLETFEGFYLPENNDKVISILAGLSFPENHFKKMEEIIEKKKGNINLNKKDSSILNINTDWFNGINNDDSPKSIKISGKDNKNSNEVSEDIDLESLFSKYN